MNTQSRTTRIERSPMYNLEHELKIRGFSCKAYLHYNRKFLNFAKNPKEIINASNSQRHFIWLPGRDSNPGYQGQNLASYH